jgi:hypothetical protein
MRWLSQLSLRCQRHRLPLEAFVSLLLKRNLRSRDRPLSTFRFRATPGWVCDISNAQKGETVLLFLVDPTDGYFGIALAGPGYMPLRNVRGKKYATLEDDVVLPEGAPVIPGPDPKYSFIRSVELSYVEKLIRHEVAGQAQPNYRIERTRDESSAK